MHAMNAAQDMVLSPWSTAIDQPDFSRNRKRIRFRAMYVNRLGKKLYERRVNVIIFE